MVHLVTTFDIKPDDLSWIPRIQVIEGEKRPHTGTMSHISPQINK